MLLLVVLSLLVLFMLIGTAFLMSSSQSSRSAKSSAKYGRLGSPPTKLLDRAVMQVLRDTNNPRSAVRSHSLLRDMYGADGFEATVYSPLNVNLANVEGQVSRFAAATNGSAAQQLGPTQGQLIDIYVRQLAFNPATAKSADDPLTPDPPTNENVALNAPDARHVLKLEKDLNGQPQVHPLPLTKGYYNGCLLTITSGPAAGQSTRIIDYEYIGDLSTLPTSVGSVSRLFRFRVMAFPRADGTPLQINAARAPELGDLAGATFIVNGRPFNGTGVGYNPLAEADAPRLNAVEVRAISGSEWIGAETALLPNSAYFVNLPSVYAFTNKGADPFLFNWSTRHFRPLNPEAVPVRDRPVRWKYPSYVGPGDTDESYDAADFQNMFLALQTVTPRPRGRVVHSGSTVPLEVDDPQVVDSNGRFVNTNRFLRLDLEDLPLPSFHRPDLVNFWYHRMLNSQWLMQAISDANDRAKAVLQPYDAQGDLSPWVPSEAVAGQILQIKRRISMRPLREDHPSFDGGNPSSRPRLERGDRVVDASERNIAIPYWEAVGPWDVDNDNDGVADSVWVDLGEPVVQAENGTLYKPLYAFLVLDLDSRLNVNAHGLVEHLQAPELDPNNNSLAGIEDSDFLPHGIGYGPAEISLRPVLSPRLPGSRLSGNVGDPGIVNALDADDYARLLVGRPASATVPSVWGRHGSTDVWQATDVLQALDRVKPGMTYSNLSAVAAQATSDRLAALKMFGHPGWLSEVFNVDPAMRVPTAFGTPPDLMGRYALGVDHVGQPVYEQRADYAALLSFGIPDASLLVDSPYELNLSDPVRRDTPDPSVISALRAAAPGPAPLNDDAPFATADLERLLRSFDADSGILPDRLWNVVDAFDPVKLFQNQPTAVLATAQQLFNAPGLTTADEPQVLAAAQQLASINRRLVTTDSYDLPVPGQNMPAWASALGPDGKPGIADFDDGTSGTIDDATEIGWRNDTANQYSDDFQAVTGRPHGQATIVDLLRYRVFLDRRRLYIQSQSLTEPLTPAQQQTMLPILYGETQAIVDVGQLAQAILPPEIIAGKRMDLNRPFGDGRDNGDYIDNDGINGIDDVGERKYPVGDVRRDPFMNGIVDEPFEAGEPFLDLNGNGKYDNGEPFIDMLKDGAGGRTDLYDGPRDGLWPELWPAPIGNATLGEQIVFDYTNGHGEPLAAQVLNTSGLPTTARVRNLDAQGRQLYARQLYCLMMLLVDEGYLETPDVPSLGGNNVNLEFYLFEIARRRGRPFAPNDDDRALALRKLTARRIAQWAVNCVDFRDADGIMTAFEYDENPWDGWGVWHHDAAGNVHEFIPLDGDTATNENGSEAMLEGDLLAQNRAQVIDWQQVATQRTRVVGSNLAGGPTTIADQSRGVVWGVERPELLITETLAFHDRRATDEDIPGSVPPSPQINNPGSPPQIPPDYDLDQRLKPRGSLFVELYNPWSEDGQKPAEFYGQVDIDPTQAGMQPSDQGVMLNKLSDLAAREIRGPANHPVQTINRRSPVWRLAVVREPFGGAITNQIFDVTAADAAYNMQFLSMDPDGFGFSSDRDAERLVYFTTGDDYATIPSNPLDPRDPNHEGDRNRADDDNIEDNAAQLGEYNFAVGAGTAPVPVMRHLNVWVPPLPWREDQITGELSPIKTPTAKRYFIARTERQSPAVSGSYNDRDVPIAPILPGRCAVVGTAGLQLVGTSPDILAGSSPRRPYSTPDWDDAAAGTKVTERFVTPIGRLVDGGDQDDADQLSNLHENRRIELWPQPNPQVNQLLVGDNGGPEFVRMAGNSTPVNVSDPELDGHPANTPDANMLVAPCVAIPVEDMNVSEPVEGYPSHQYQDMYNRLNDLPPFGGQRGGFIKSDVKLNDDGELEFETWYDHPLDLDLELVRNGTTQNYRTLHLQRLANPMLPWNPPPLNDDGSENPLHQRHLPVNPYRTIDSQSVDLTAFNGATDKEDTALPSTYANNQDRELQGELSGDPTQLEPYGPVVLDQFKYAPDHVIWGLIYILNTEIGRPWMTPKDFRDALDTVAGRQDLENAIDQLINQDNRKGTSDDIRDRGVLQAERHDEYGRDWSGMWGWSLFRRVLPYSGFNENPPGLFRQHLHLKSLERGEHDFRPTFQGWVYDEAWVPRLLWKQERPNFKLSLRSGGRIVEYSDLYNSLSKPQFLVGTNLPVDTQERNRLIRTNPAFGLGTHALDYVLEHTLGFVNESFAPELDRADGSDAIAMMSTLRPGAPEVRLSNPLPVQSPDAVENQATPRAPSAALPAQIGEQRRRLLRSTYPWLAWNNRPFTSGQEIMHVPAGSSSLMLRDYSTINGLTPNPYDGDGMGNGMPETAPERIARQQSPFGHLLNYFLTSVTPAKSTGASGALELTGAPNYHRILDYVHVPSRYVGTETLLAPEVFNDDPARPSSLPNDPDDIAGPTDPRLALQPPFNTVSREREPGRVNINTIVGRRAVDPTTGAPRIWSDVYDGVMHRYADGNLFDTGGNLLQLSHLGPAWRDVTLSRRGYAQVDAAGSSVDYSGAFPDTYQFGLNNNYPSMFSNPFRSPDAGDLVPLAQLQQYGVDVSMLRVHPRVLGNKLDDDGDGTPDNEDEARAWGDYNVDDDGNGIVDDIREAGYAGDALCREGDESIPEKNFGELDRSVIPLFSETTNTPSIDAYRNPYMMYQPMTRLGNLVTTRSNVYAIWVTVGYFEVEPAPDWNHPDDDVREAIRARFGGTLTDTDPETIAARALYDRVYPEGYALGAELGSDTGNTKRERAFYIIDRTEPVGFKPGEDLNVERMIRVRRRIE